MKHIPLLLLALILAACGGDTADDSARVADTDTAETAMADGTETTMERPDPMNPAGEEQAVPEGWMWRLDSPDPDAVVSADTATADIFFVNMTPGWHVTMGQPRAILYHPASTAEGNYTAMAKLHLFDPGPRRNEGYGIFVGGQDLQGPNQQYLYFLLRRSGEYLVKVRDGDSTETVTGWTAHDAIVPYDESTTGTATNTLAVSTSADSIDFVVNDTVVHTMGRADLPTNGIFGLRLNHAINVHVEDLAVTEAM